ncbi:MAG: hypothetical protein CL609_14630 [Anaerolineaceae bacterium]|nr:hypothetical protein [Anaerolineaceae bacterium]
MVPNESKRIVIGGLDWNAVVAAGLISGFTMLIISILLPWIFLSDPFLIVRIMASVLLGPSVISPQAGLVPGIYVVAILTHFFLSIFFAMLIVLIFHRWGMIVAFIGGAVMGFVIYFMNYYTFSLVFPWLLPYHTWMLLTGHIVFGALVGTLYELFEDEHFVDQQFFKRPTSSYTL